MPMPRTANAIRNFAIALSLPLIGAATMSHPSPAQTQAAAPTTTGVLVILTAKPGIARDQIMAVMPAEVRATVQLYLGGKIREWFARADGRGAVFLLDTKDVHEAETIMDALPLAKQSLMDHEYIAVGPLFPLRLLLATPDRQQ
jgi:hypothetical protein